MCVSWTKQAVRFFIPHQSNCSTFCIQENAPGVISLCTVTHFHLIPEQAPNFLFLINDSRFINGLINWKRRIYNNITRYLQTIRIRSLVYTVFLYYIPTLFHFSNISQRRKAPMVLACCTEYESKKKKKKSERMSYWIFTWYSFHVMNTIPYFHTDINIFTVSISYK